MKFFKKLLISGLLSVLSYTSANADPARLKLDFRKFSGEDKRFNLSVNADARKDFRFGEGFLYGKLNINNLIEQSNEIQRVDSQAIQPHYFEIKTEEGFKTDHSNLYFEFFHKNRLKRFIDLNKKSVNNNFLGVRFGVEDFINHSDISIEYGSGFSKSFTEFNIKLPLIHFKKILFDFHATKHKQNSSIETDLEHLIGVGARVNNFLFYANQEQYKDVDNLWSFGFLFDTTPTRYERSDFNGEAQLFIKNQRERARILLSADFFEKNFLKTKFSLYGEGGFNAYGNDYNFKAQFYEINGGLKAKFYNLLNIRTGIRHISFHNIGIDTDHLNSLDVAELAIGGKFYFTEYEASAGKGIVGENIDSTASLKIANHLFDYKKMGFFIDKELKVYSYGGKTFQEISIGPRINRPLDDNSSLNLFIKYHDLQKSKFSEAFEEGEGVLLGIELKF